MRGIRSHGERVVRGADRSVARLAGAPGRDGVAYAGALLFIEVRSSRLSLRCDREAPGADREDVDLVVATWRDSCLATARGRRNVDCVGVVEVVEDAEVAATGVPPKHRFHRHFDRAEVLFAVARVAVRAARR